MFALCFALALALHGNPFVQSATAQSVGPLAAAQPAVHGPVAIPYGQASGTYDIAAGKLLALLEDASGLPLWVLEAEVYEDGGIDGDLLPLRYATNPVLGGVSLTVSGQMLLDELGNGVFYATVYEFGGGAIPVFPVALIEGAVKQPALGHSLPASAGASGLIAGAGQQVDGGGVIVCPKARAVAGHELLLGPGLARVQLRWWLLQ